MHEEAKPAHRVRSILLGLVATSLALHGCGSSSNATTNFSNSAAPAPSIAFESRPLPGAFGPASIVYLSPAYAVGTVNDGNGLLSALDMQKAGLFPIEVYPRVPYDVRAADFNGDGIPDVISTVYTPTNVDSWAYLFFGNADGTFTQDPTFGMQYVTPDGAGFRGRTETIVVADFTNSGAVDIFLPTYTYLDSTYDLGGDPSYEGPGAPPNVHNAVQSFLLLNDGTGKFVERAVAAGVSMHSTLSGIAAPTTDPRGNQPEGAQAVDFNMDGLIDLYAGGHLFINLGVDNQGIPHFQDMAASWGLTPAVLRASPPWASNGAYSLPPDYLVNDEGAKFLDWNNDGRLDLLLFRWDWGTAHGARLFEFTGTQFIERTLALTMRTPSCQHPPSSYTAFFSSNRPAPGDGGAAGINAYDLENDGLEDVLVSGDSTGAAVFHNTGCGFVEVPVTGISTRPGGSGAMALADLDGDGVIDIFYPTSAGDVYFENTSAPRGQSFTVEVLGPNGEHNQFGRVIQVIPSAAEAQGQIFTRVVDSGSGYLSQNQYPILVGTPYPGAHSVKVYFAPLTTCAFGGPSCHASVLTFSISPGQYARAYAPSASSPSGHVLITNGH